MKTVVVNQKVHQRGFTLVELMVAAMVMAVGLLGLTSLQAMAIRTAGTSSRMQDAIRVGEEVLEEASAEAAQSYLGMLYSTPPTQAMKYIGVAPAPAFYKYRTVADAQGDVGTLMPGSAADNIFTATWTTTPMAAAGRGQLTQITVTVTFTEGLDATTNLPVVKTMSFSREVAHG